MPLLDWLTKRGGQITVIHFNEHSTVDFYTFIVLFDSVDCRVHSVFSVFGAYFPRGCLTVMNMKNIFT